MSNELYRHELTSLNDKKVHALQAGATACERWMHLLDIDGITKEI